jgi:integrase
MSRMLGKNFERTTKRDIEKLVAKVEHDSNLGEWRKYDYKVTLRFFYKWLEGGGEKYPKKVSWIKLEEPSDNNITPSDLLTEEEIIAMIKAARNARDAAFIGFVYEGEPRPGESLFPQLKHVVEDENGITVYVAGKMGKKMGLRPIFLVASESLIKRWLREHPFRDNPEAPLWVGIGKENLSRRLDYDAMRRMLKNVAKRAGIKKPVFPRLFRHSRNTILSPRLSKSVKDKMAGWTPNSKRSKVYEHLSNVAVQEGVLNMYGLPVKKQELLFVPNLCAVCGARNACVEETCIECGTSMKEEVQEKIKESKTRLSEQEYRAIKEKVMEEVKAEMEKELEEYKERLRRGLSIERPLEARI